jgi:hypothetical protein
VALLVGGGVKRDLSDRWGWSLDLRTLIGPDRRVTSVSTAAAVDSGSPPGAVIETRNLPVVFSTRPELRTSLSAEPVVDFETFRATGTRSQFRLAIGMYRRF